LSFAQGIKGLGSASSSYLVSAVAGIALFAGMGWRGAFPVFFVLMAFALVSVALLKVEETKADEPPSIASSLGLLGKPIFLFAVLGIFLYVGAEASMGRFLKPMLRDAGISEAAANKFGAPMFFLLLTIGRLVGGVVLTVLSARTFFRLSSLLGLLGALALMTGVRWLAFPGVIAAGLGFANIWPLLFSITVEEKPDRANELSGLMCMAISGGAIVPLVMGGLVDLKFGAYAFIVPAACFAYLLVLSLKRGRVVAAN
jgi:fucose permease